MRHLIGIAVCLASMASGRALAQTPDLDGPYNPVTFAGQLTTSDGLPWTSGATARLTFSNSSEVRLLHLPSDPGGYYSIISGVPETVVEAGGTVQATVWAYDSGLQSDNACQFFLDPELGRAAFGPPLQIDEVDGHLSVSADYSLSLPPLYSTVLLTGATGTSVQMRVTDFVPPTTNSWYDPTWEASQVAKTDDGLTLPGAGTYDLFRWSVSPGAHVFLHSGNGAQVGHALVRRMESISTAISSERALQVNVDLTAHPDAQFICIVAMQDHSPNPAAGIESNRSVWLQLRDAICNVPVESGSPSFAQSFRFADEDCVVELWSSREVNGGLQVYLAAYQAVSASQALPSITFN